MNVDATLPPQALLAIGAVLLYVGGRAAVSSLVRNSPSPGRRAVGHSLPIAMFAALAAVMHHTEIAIAILFATSVACLALIGGCIVVGPRGPTAVEMEPWPLKARKVAMLLVPVALLTFLIGLSSRFTFLSAIVMLLQGAVILYVRNDPADAESPNNSSIKPGIFILALALCAIGGWILVHGTAGAMAKMQLPSPGPLLPAVIAPLIAASMLPDGTALAARGQTWAAMATHIGVAEINLCLLLPVLALTYHFNHASEMYFPMTVWRVDSVTLVLLAAAIFPSAIGRWQTGRADGAVLLFIFVAYVLASIVVSVLV